MLAPITDPDAYIESRTAWHTLAERVLAPARHTASGRIGLRPAPGGVTTPEFGDGVTIALDGLDLVRTERGTVTRAPISTLAAASAFVGIEPDLGTGVFEPTTPANPDAPLRIDPVAVAVIAEWFAFGERVITAWRHEHADETPSELQLWPEHFDLALDLGPDAARANYGASPGDDGHPLPYLYVGPWEPNADPFWNGGSYAQLGYDEIAAAADPAARAADFFATGHAATRKS